MNQPLEVALKYVQAGISCIPIRLDGSKSPAIPAWQEYQKRLPTEEEVRQWFAQPRGIGVIGGAVSGNLECIDIERQESFDEWRQLVEEAMPGLVGKLVISTTPGGKYDSCGFHVRYRVDGDAFGCQKLAKLNATNLLAELKGEGGYALAPGGDARAHPSGKEYFNIQGRLSELPIISTAERDILIAKAIELNQYEEPVEEYQPQVSADAGDRPGDRFNARGDFSFLTNYGWKLLGGSEGKHYWKRPGKDTQGISATTGFCRGKDGTPRLYVFSTNAAPFQDNKYYSPFSAYVYLKHNGDWKAASRDVAHQLGMDAVFKPIIGPPPAEVVAADGEIIERTPHKVERALFPTGVFPEPLQHTINEIARVIGCPADSVGTLMLSLASIGIGNTRKIALRRTWKESASLYVALVAFPGEGKSPVMQELAAPLYKWQHDLHEQHKHQMADYARDEEQYKEDKKAGKEVSPPPKPVYGHVYTTDATTEKLAEILDCQPRGIGMSQDEVTALVQGMNQYKAGKGRDRQFFLSAWSGSPCKVDRKNNPLPLIVKDPFITIFGGIQPEMLGLLKDEFGREDGFVHRFLFSYPPLRELQPWGTPEIDQAALNSWASCFNRLITLSQHTETDGQLRPWVCQMTTDADAVWKLWYDEIIQSMADMPPQFRGPSHKLIAYAARLSLIMQMLGWATNTGLSDRQIDAESVRAGCLLANYFGNHLRLVYGRLHDQPEDVRANEMLEWIRKRGGKATAKEVVRCGPNWARKTSTAIKLFQDLEDRGHGICYQSKNDKNGKEIKWFETNVRENS